VAVLEFFHAAGVPVLEGYGMTESSGIGTVTTLDRFRLGAVGVASPGVRLRLADDGEVLMAGPHVFAGYWRDEAATEASLVDGWLHTGDLGTLDAEGNLSISGRKKEIIITAGGKNISPAKVEAELKAAGPAIAHACAIGDRRPYLTALLVLEPGAEESTVPEAVAVANARLARAEQIKRYTILHTEWRPGGPELTPTQKLKRRSVLTRYAAEIEAMYTS
jgi:long-chain acyl-CoA synthetase